MCGRFVATTDPAALAAAIDAVDETGPARPGPNYNVAPTDTVTTVVAAADGIRRLRPMRWGLLPGWVTSDADGRPLAKSLLINARAEKVTSSPAFRAAAEHKRCLVPMDGYYEWMPNADVAPRQRSRKTPFYIHRQDGRPLFAAGLWSAWRPRPAGSAGPVDPVLTCTIITTDAVGEFSRVHDRMPLVLGEGDWDRWLDPGRSAPTALLEAPPDTRGIAMREVSTLVNNVANNGPNLIEPADPGNQPAILF